MDPQERPGWRAIAVAAFATAHLACVATAALPYPPATGDELLEHPEVRAEIRTARLSDERARDLLRLVRWYGATLDDARGAIGFYLRLTGSVQSWHMFGGTPPRFPLVFVVEVRPRGAPEFVPFQDLNWGTADSAALNFRHRKVQEFLAGWGAPLWDDYARYWARCWDERHPDRPAAAVRLSVTRLTTPDPERVRAGDTDRQPETGLAVHEWAVP